MAGEAMISFWGTFLYAGLVILALMVLLWLFSLALKDASIVDIFWGTGFVIVNWFYFTVTPDGSPVRKWLMAALVTIWGLRLSLYLLWRNVGKREDFRYRKWRREAGARWWWYSFFKVFLLQGALIWIISTPLLAAQLGATPARLTVLDWIAVLVWGIGFFFEAVGDWQLARFKADPANKGKLLTWGVWRYTRHPNYFGDAVQWWAFFMIAAAAGGWYTILSPIVMTILLRFVSGVKMLEQSLKPAKQGYDAYMATTNAFVPWFPRKE